MLAEVVLMFPASDLGQMEKASRPVVITTNMRSFVDSHRCRLVSESEGTQTPIAQLSWIQVRPVQSIASVVYDLICCSLRRCLRILYNVLARGLILTATAVPGPGIATTRANRAGCDSHDQRTG